MSKSEVYPAACSLNSTSVDSHLLRKPYRILFVKPVRLRQRYRWKPRPLGSTSLGSQQRLAGGWAPGARSLRSYA